MRIVAPKLQRYLDSLEVPESRGTLTEFGKPYADHLRPDVRDHWQRVDDFLASQDKGESE